MPTIAPLLSRNPLLQQSRVRFRRLMQEGFRGFLVSISLLSGAAILTTIYMHDRAALEEAVRNEIIQTVGTRQEPSDSAKELGLIATALAKVNAAPPPERNCTQKDQPCAPADQLPGKLVAAAMPEVIKAAGNYLTADGNWDAPPEAIHDIYTLKENPEVLSWPELGQGPICEDEGGGTFLMIPAQMRSSQGPPFAPRVAAAAQISGSLFQPLPKFVADEKLSGYMVQAYFISPDSLLRIWSYRHTDVCKEFSKTRLWAAKSYFAQFWEGPQEESYSTLAYIDYGGNGLVRTTCHSVELPRVLPGRTGGQTDFPRGHFLGILCMDFKLSDEQVRLMQRQLFFETANVSFPIHEISDLDQIAVQVILPDENPSGGSVAKTGGIEPAKTAQTLNQISYNQVSSRQASSSQANSSQAGSTGTSAGDKGASSKEDRILRAAIDLQSCTLTEAEVQQTLYADLRNFDVHSLLREITRISFRGKPAFLLPLGLSDGKFQGLFFYPRSPRLPWWDNCFAVLGLLLAGSALASAGNSWRTQPKIAELRQRISLFRNLQVGIVRVDPDDWIIESNDRAEELFNRKLPKPGFEVRTPVNFLDLIERRVRERESKDGQDGIQYEEIPPDEIRRMRRSGQASSYYGRLGAGSSGNGAKPQWLFVQATPIMLPHAGRRRKGDAAAETRAEARRRNTREVRLYGVFATISEVCPERIRDLEAMPQGGTAKQEAQ
jgi:PAS domain-containing protein